MPFNSFDDILDDLCARFLVNLPAEEQATFERIGFQIEQAFWYYEDFYRDPVANVGDEGSGDDEFTATAAYAVDFFLPKLSLKEFGGKLLQRYPPLQQRFSKDYNRLFDNFFAYKSQIPTCGAIILTPGLDKCILVKGWSSKSAWGFPKGKIGKDEDHVDCAIREVLEETGFDISPYIKRNDFIEKESRDAQSARLYIVVARDVHSTDAATTAKLFQPQTRKEISKISWFSINDLPSAKSYQGGDIKGVKFYNVIPFVAKLKSWIQTTRKKTSLAAPTKGKKEEKEVKTIKLEVKTKNSKDFEPKVPPLIVFDTALVMACYDAAAAASEAKV